MATLRGSQAPNPQAGKAAGRRKPATAGRPYLEIQYHPGDIRRGVRYLFLSRHQVAGWIAGGLAYVALLGCGLAITPTVIGNHLSAARYHELQEERNRHGERLKAFVERLSSLEAETGQAWTKMSKIHRAYDLPESSPGLGGYPTPPLSPLGEENASIYRQAIERGRELTAGLMGRTEALGVFVDEVRAFEAANRDQVMSTPSLSPLHRDTFVMTSPYGTRRSPFTDQIDFHAGIDMAARTGTQVNAPSGGTVVYAGQFPERSSAAWWRYGKLVVLRHSPALMTLYGHCDEVRVKRGDEVERGQIIATVGNTGWSTNPHLHYEIRWRDDAGDWHPVDPRIYILDQDWSHQELVLIRGRQAPSTKDYEPLPRTFGR